MICPEEGLLQSYIDNELDPEEKNHIERHLLSCENCAAVYKGLKDTEDFTGDMMGRYSQYVSKNYSSSKGKAWNGKYPEFDRKLINDYSEKKERRGAYLMSYVNKYRKMAAGFCIALLAIVCVKVLPVSAAVTSFLSIFRVENISGINLSASDIQEIQDVLSQNNADVDIEKFGKIETSGGEKQRATFAEAEEFIGFPVLKPMALAASDPEITKVDPQVMNFTLDVDGVNEVLKSYGSEELLPSDIDRKTFTLNLSRKVSMKYRVNGEDIYIIQTTAPELVVPEGVDADEVYQSLINLPIIPDNLQRQLASIKDWKNTIYIPVTGTDTKEVDINGWKGYIGSKEEETGKTYSAVIWSENGIIRSIEGFASSEEILEIARSMK